MRYKFAYTILLLLISTASLASLSSGLPQSFHANTSGLINYGLQQYVTVDSTSVLGVNTLSLGFQVDGYDIRRFRDSSTLRQLAEDANFKLVRFFHHRLGEPCSNWNEDTQTGTFNWNSIDPLIEGIFEIGAEPLICFGYYSPSTGHVTVPRGMATDNDGLPRPESWANYCVYWLRHLEARNYPVRFFEIINEPYQLYFWTDSDRLARYTTFWNTVASAMRAENPNIFISHDGSTAKNALDYWIDNGDTLDFLGFHKYDSSTRNSATDSQLFSRAESERLTDYGGSDSNWRNYGIADARSLYGDVPVICGEANINWAYNPTDSRIQTMVGAVWAAITVRFQALMGLDYWLWWNLAGHTSTEDFGMIDGETNEPYYPYYALHMIGSNLDLGDQFVETSCDSDDIRALAWIHNDELNLLLICKADTTQTINLHGLTGQLSLTKIDNTIPYTNPAVQTGTINADEPLTLNGYTVMLLQSPL